MSGEKKAENMEKIIGIGVDGVSRERVRKACEKTSFITKYYSEEEQKLIWERQNRAATNFAGKEAVAKAFGTGFAEGISPKEIEILRNEKGAPFVRLSGKAKEYAEDLCIENIHISLTDTKEHALAYVIAVGNSVFF